MTSVDFLTSGQLCWDWFCLRRGHVTSSVAARFMSLAHSIAKCAPNSVALRRLMNAAPQRLVDAWHGTWHGNRFTQAGTSNKPAVMEQLAKDRYIRHIFEAGLAESKAERWLATSPAAIGAVDAVYLKAQLQHMCPAVRRLSGGVSHLPFEFTTLAETNRNKYAAIAADHATPERWQACSMDSETFKTLVPHAAYRRQLVHSVATFDSPAIVFVAACERAGNPVISKTLVIAAAGVVAHHVRTLKVLAGTLFDWVHAGPKARAPAWFDPKVAQQLESYQAVWWATRMKVMCDGPLHPVETIRLAPVVIYNKYVSAVLCASHLR